MLSTWFAYPWLLWVLLALPAAAACMLFAFWRRRRLSAQLAASPLLRKSVLVRPGVRRWRALCILGGLTLLALGAAGPHWGIDKDAQHRKGRDVIIVLDLSRSMNAEQPSRRELAVRALRHLADTFEDHGGNRVALVAFAAEPRLLFPFTQDCDHLRHVLSQIEDRDIARLSGDEPAFGTRIGAALSLAVLSADPRRTNRPVIVLVSDGDDPAADNEWTDGVGAAKEKQIRVHTVGVGDPARDAPIPAGREFVHYQGKPVHTKLNEELLREIARRTEGFYLPAYSEDFALGVYVQHLLDADELREEAPADDALPVYQLRYVWFLLPAALLLMLAMFLNEGPRVSRKESEPPRNTAVPRKGVRARAASLVVVLVALLGVSAADPPSPEALLKQGNDAFAREDYGEAIRWFEQAELHTLDPGLVSFNRAAAHYRLKQYKEAIDAYRRSLKDDEAPLERRARAHFDLGNALLKYAGDNPQTLAEAVAEYRACLYQPGLSDKLRGDARHNLELAQMLWNKARENLPPGAKNPPESDKPKYQDVEENAANSYAEVKPGKDDHRQEASDLPNPSVKPTQMRAKGMSQHLPDSEQVRIISSEDTLATLAREARRIADARRQQQSPGGPAALTTKDW